MVTGNTVIDALLWTSSRDLGYGHPALAGLDDTTAPVLLVTAHRRESVTEPLPYGGFSALMKRATVILTDSGGVQEEGPSLGKPVLVMRETTERPEAVQAGTIRLVGTDEDLIVKSVSRLLTDRAAYTAMAGAINPYGDGHAAQRSVAALACHFGPP